MEIIAWEKLADYVVRQLPAVIPVGGAHRIVLVVEKNGGALSLRIPFGEDMECPTSPYREVTYAIAMVDKARVLELTTSTPELFRGFYLFSALVVEHVEERGDDVLNAIRRAQHVLGQLLVKRPLLSDERQVGLIGELCALAGVLRGWGKFGLEAWVGPLGERHDFRFGEIEIEVKSTTTAARKHTINSVGQLEASPGRSLHLLSLQFELAGMAAGESLAGRANRVAELLEDDITLLTRFQQQLSALGYHAADAALYVNKYQLRSRPMLVPVDEACPKITLDELRKAVTRENFSRIGDITYEVNLSGLGFSETTAMFRKILTKVARLE